MVATATACSACGSTQIGTRFCETCGASVGSQTSAASSSAVLVDGGVGATPVRVLTVVSFVLAETAPGWLEMINGSSGNYLPELWRGSSIAFASVAGVLALVSVITGRAGATAKAFGALLAVLYVAINVVVLYVPLFDYSAIPVSVVMGFAYAALYLSWALGRPFRGRGYFGLSVVVAVSVLLGALPYVPGIQSSYLGWLTVVSLATLVGVVLVVGLSLIFENRPQSELHVGPVSSETSAPAGRFGKVALGLVLGSVGFQLVSSILTGFGVGFSLGGFRVFLSLVALGALIAGIVYGHIAITQARRAGLKQDGMGLAALIVGYSLIGLGVVAVVIQLLVFASLSAAFS